MDVELLKRKLRRLLMFWFSRQHKGSESIWHFNTEGACEPRSSTRFLETRVWMMQKATAKDISRAKAAQEAKPKDISIELSTASGNCCGSTLLEIKRRCSFQFSTVLHSVTIQKNMRSAVNS
jgi:hypothetical protein